MRISSSPSPALGGIVNQPTSGELAAETPLAKDSLTQSSAGGDQAFVQFGQANDNTSFFSDAEQSGSSLMSLLTRSSSSESTSSVDQDSVQVSPMTSVSTASASPAAAASDPANAPSATDAAFLDNSEYSSPEALKRWDPMVAHLPPEEREQAAKELNRPIAAAWMAREHGPNADKAMAFINANPALKTAVDVGKDGGNADGKITNKDLKAFAKNSEKAADNADKDLAKYMEDNPGADPQSLEMVRSAAVMRANMPLATAADPHHADGAPDKTDVDGNVSAEGLKALIKSNPGLSGTLKQSSNMWSQAGFLSQVDEAGLTGRKKAAHSPDQVFDASNMSEWIRKSAPKNGGQFASMLSDAATLNSVAGIDISKLNAQVFEKPKAYTGAQKAAVMIKLQQTQQSVIAGRDLRNTEKTEAGLNERIAQLQADPDVQEYLNKSIPEQERSLVSSDSALQKAVTEQVQNVNSGKALQTDLATADKAVGKHNPDPDYSCAITGLSAQLQLQKDLFPDAQVPTAQQVFNNQPDEVQTKIADSYVRNFSEGGALKQLLGQKKADASEALQTADNQKAAYESVLPADFVEGEHENYTTSTLNELQNSKKGRKLLEGKSDEEGGPSLLAQLADAGAGGKVLNSVMGFASVSTMLANGDKLGATQAIYDSTKLGAEAIKGGVDAGAKMMGREASAGLGRLGGQMIGRAVGLVAGEATGLAAGAALGAAIPVIGWAIDGAMALGFGISAIIDAVKKHKAQKAFDHNVDPVLDQFGIDRAH
ncbi:type III effector HrpK domain-containing protein [Pseudomonas amygdali]|uniref:type III effector HrpK domain-containing protein n=1 Tax=Pseudomonas amygdali TaxID=47877 RepID=UPI0005C85547|nr:type III effector HrpK domain-containing protein [Pseudomonas amygdali]PHN40940.1 type III effector HrpK [Pseudomonas amygdali]